MREQLQRAIASDRDEMAALTARLIALDTENPPGRGYERCAEALRNELAALGFPAIVEPVPGSDVDAEHPRYWVRSELGSGARTVAFHGHFDVVPADDRAQFEPTVSADTIFGRGSTDMKGGIVSMLYAMKALRAIDAPLEGRIALQLVPDEETGGALGSGALSRHEQLVPDGTVAMLTAEPTGGIVWHASRGAITCRVTMRGRHSHVGLQYRGKNAFETMLPVTDALRRLKNEVEARRTEFPLEPDAARHSILMMGGDTAGGRNFNVVPDHFAFTVDRRINPEEDFETEKARLLETIHSAADDVEIDVFQEARPAGTSESGPEAFALARAIEEVRGAPAVFELCPGILEIRFYAEKGVPAFAYGPGLLSVAHGPNEFIKRRDMEDVALVYALVSARLLAP